MERGIDYEAGVHGLFFLSEWQEGGLVVRDESSERLAFFTRGNCEVQAVTFDEVDGMVVCRETPATPLDAMRWQGEMLILSRET